MSSIADSTPDFLTFSGNPCFNYARSCGGGWRIEHSSWIFSGFLVVSFFKQSYISASRLAVSGFVSAVRVLS